MGKSDQDQLTVEDIDERDDTRFYQGQKTDSLMQLQKEYWKGMNDFQDMKEFRQY